VAKQAAWSGVSIGPGLTAFHAKFVVVLVEHRTSNRHDSLLRYGRGRRDTGNFKCRRVMRRQTSRSGPAISPTMPSEPFAIRRAPATRIPLCAARCKGVSGPTHKSPRQKLLGSLSSQSRRHPDIGSDATAYAGASLASRDPASFAASDLWRLFTDPRRIDDEFKRIGVLVLLHQLEVDKPFSVRNGRTAIKPCSGGFKQ
jgi:hypothetical protein